MNALTEQTVGQLVVENPARARVFEKHRIDYCCGGKIPLSMACERRKVELEQVLVELEECDKVTADTGVEWSKAPLAILADHIVTAHHDYLREELPRIEGLAARVAKVHGDHAPKMIELHKAFLPFQEELTEHTEKEEGILFPWIKRLEAGGADAAPFPASVSKPIQCMESEHESAGAALDKFRELTDGFNPPVDACNTWRVLYASLETLEKDMHVHIHKENSILFPRALELEKAVVG